jgi:Phosphotransferase enzyme family
MSLKHFLPSPNWDLSIEPVLRTAAAFTPEGADELSELREWWSKESSKVLIAPWPLPSHVLHGDLRFANILVNLVNPSEVEIIDFGNVSSGHVLRDLVKFECDLLFRVLPQPMVFDDREWSSEELRSHSLRYAFTSDFLCLNAPTFTGPNTYPHLQSLQIIRAEYNRKWRVGGDKGREIMYRWFLLGEVLRRLGWLEREFTSRAARRALLYSSLIGKRAIENRADDIPAFAAVDDMVRHLGVKAAYVAVKGDTRAVNERRNASKIAALREAADGASPVCLIAETGHSYLSTRRPFFSSVRAIAKKGLFKVVLCNRSFVEAHAISAAYQTT